MAAMTIIKALEIALREITDQLSMDEIHADTRKQLQAAADKLQPFIEEMKKTAKAKPQAFVYQPSMREVQLLAALRFTLPFAQAAQPHATNLGDVMKLRDAEKLIELATEEGF